MAISPTAGSRLFIGTTATTQSPDTGYVEVGEILDGGTFGRIYTLITTDTLGTRGTRKFKGTYNDGAMTLKLNRDSADAGQQAAILARDSDSDYNFKVTLNDAAQTPGQTINTTFFFKAKVMSYTVELSGPNNVVASTVVLELKSGTLVEAVAT